MLRMPRIEKYMVCYKHPMDYPIRQDWTCVNDFDSWEEADAFYKEQINISPSVLLNYNTCMPPLLRKQYIKRYVSEIRIREISQRNNDIFK